MRYDINWNMWEDGTLAGNEENPPYRNPYRPVIRWIIPLSKSSNL